VAPQLPDRYQTQVRLGRDGDIDEWLATDTALDRPVLVRVLDPDANPQRVAEFVTATRKAATVEHVHLAGIYEVAESSSGGAYAALEWNGGVSIADRLAAGETLPVSEFLPNAAGLAEGLAALHDAGVVHGSIDPGAIVFSAAHPAKLSSFGRKRATLHPQQDTAALAHALRIAVTGSASPAIRPSHLVEGLPSSVDDAIQHAEKGDYDAASLGTALRAIPSSVPPSRKEGWSWRWLIPAGMLLLSAVVVSGVGLAIDVDPDSPFLFPATPPVDRSVSTTTTAAPPQTTIPEAPPPGVLGAQPDVYDPEGDQSEHERLLPNLIDGNFETTWRTERYFDPLSSIKAGVGVTFRVAGAPGTVELRATPGTGFSVLWAETIPANIGGWEQIASGTIFDAPSVLQLPNRDGGVWLVWLTDLPEQRLDEFFSEVSEVTFRP
jgi:serine/threonine protein kinase